VSLAFDIGQGAGLAGATGVRPFLPPILTGALASGDIGVDFDGTSFDWVESPGFLLAVLALSVAVYMYERQAAPAETREGRSPLQAALAVIAMVLGAVLFGASLAEGGETEWPGVIAGMLCAFLGFAAVALLFARARARLEGGAAALLNVYADVTSVALAALSILFPPLGFVVLAGFVVMLIRAQRGGAQKYEGLRILR
jgi:cytochrome bd-type quinol oxidase subunit 2